MGFVFEKDLPHQTRAVEGVLSAFAGIGVSKTSVIGQNPELELAGQGALLKSNLKTLRSTRDFQQAYKFDTDAKEHIFDISMETGTGKTYAYTKTMFELNKQTGIAKFIIAVPRVAIKAGTVSFLKSDAAREHFRDAYGRDIKVYEVQSQKANKSKKDHIPQAITDFCRADIAMNKNAIHVLVINAGMITAKKTLKAKDGDVSVPALDWKHDVGLFDKFHTPNEAIVHTKPVLIVDEPHMFKRGNTTYKAMMKFEPQFVLRYGATFDDDLINMVNELTAVEAFNEDLVKGIIAHIEVFDEANNVSLKLMELTGSEAKFELKEDRQKSKHALSKGQSFKVVHPYMQGLEVTSMNKSKLVLSNGLELSKGETINPYSYAESLQNKMVQNAIRVHFENERELFLASPRIKPLTLFFIDNINSYRDKDGTMRIQFEAMLKGHIEALVKTETHESYKAHLQAAQKDISKLHGGYFSKDNSDKDEAIEAETLEILHEKEKLLDFSNPRRFIFSKWTLREGWDNPNVFTICKLRSSGSDTSKLQEVGRGLRLPVNEFMSRDKSKTYFLNYFVDFTEKEFAEKLKDEINGKSSAEFNTVKLDDALKARLLKAYDEFANDENILLEKLFDGGIIKMNHDYKDGGFEALKAEYPNTFSQRLKKNKVKPNDDLELKTTIRAGKYAELKELWEKLNKKVVLEYKFKSDGELAELFLDYLRSDKDDYTQTGLRTESFKVQIMGNSVGLQSSASEAKITAIRMLSYTKFLESLSSKVVLSVQSLHGAFVQLKADIDINQYLSQTTIRTIHKGFNDYLLNSVFGKFEVGYRETSNKIHPTRFTNKKGEPISKIDSNQIGSFFEDGPTPSTYLFDEIYYDGKLELKNIKTDIKQVIVYSKIPKNSIRIPLVGGGSYSPDFAYLVKTNDGKSQLSLVVETKGKDKINFGNLEYRKIKHAEAYFNQSGNQSGMSHSVKFETQLQNKEITKIIQDTLACM